MAIQNINAEKIKGTFSSAAVTNGITLGAVGSGGYLKILGTSSGTVTIQTSTSAGTWTLTLPNTAGTASYVLQTDGSGITSWVSQGGGITGPQGPGGSGNYAISATAPSGPTSGDRWYDLTTGLEYVYINDGDSSQWISPAQVGPQGNTGSQGRTGPQGVQGFTGPQGFQGIQGSTGVQGFQGFTGPQGAGAQGSTGPQGSIPLASYMRGSRSAQQTTGLTVNSLVVFTQVDNYNGSDITLATASGQITLAANKTYRILGQVPNIVTSGGNMALCWYNETSGAYIGSISSVYSPSNGAGYAAFGGLSEALLTTTASTVISYRITNNSSVTGLGGNTDFATAGSYPWFDIEVISGFSAALNGATGSQGPQGITGPQGVTGPQGSGGPTGAGVSSGTVNQVAYYTGSGTVSSTGNIVIGTNSVSMNGVTLTSGTISVLGNISATGSLSITGNSTLTGTLLSGTHSVLGNISATGSLSVTNNITAGGLSSSTNNLLYAGSNGLISSTSSLAYDGVTLKMNYQSGDEGGEMFLNKAVTNTSINTGVTIDIYQNKLRFFESGGSVRGAYIDITTQAAGVATNISPNAWLYVTRNTNQTIPSGNWASQDIIFNNSVVANNITYNTSTGRATLTSGTYRITARLAWSAGATYLIQYSCFDSSNNQLGPTVEQIQPTSGSNNVSSGDLDFIYVASTTIDVKIRTTSSTNALNGEYIRGDLNTQFIIQKIG